MHDSETITILYFFYFRWKAAQLSDKYQFSCFLSGSGIIL
jgi:hypothetical protein